MLLSPFFQMRKQMQRWMKATKIAVGYSNTLCLPSKANTVPTLTHGHICHLHVLKVAQNTTFVANMSHVFTFRYVQNMNHFYFLICLAESTCIIQVLQCILIQETLVLLSWFLFLHSSGSLLVSWKSENSYRSGKKRGAGMLHSLSFLLLYLICLARLQEASSGGQGNWRLEPVYVKGLDVRGIPPHFLSCLLHILGLALHRC